MIWLALLLTAAFFSLRVLSDSLVPELRRLVRRFNPLVLVVAALCGVLSFAVIVPAGHVGVAVVLGKVRTRSFSEGLNLINPFAVVHDMTVRTETYTMSAVMNEGAVKGDDSIQALSADGLLMPLDITVAYRLVSADAPWLYRDIGPNYVDKIVRPAARTAVREAIAGIYSPGSLFEPAGGTCPEHEHVIGQTTAGSVRSARGTGESTRFCHRAGDDS
jgi:hypothetical protein